MPTLSVFFFKDGGLFKAPARLNKGFTRYISKRQPLSSSRG